MSHYLIDKQHAHDRQRTIQKMADMQRLAQIAQVYRPGLTGRLLIGLGRLMVEGGTRLKARYEAQMHINRHPAGGLRTDAKNAEYNVIGY